jgi:hypothetical protein
LHEPPGFKGYAYARKIADLELKSSQHTAVLSAQYGFVDLGSKPQDILKKVQAAKQSQLLDPRWSVKKNENKMRQFRGAKCLSFNSLVLDKKHNQDMTLTGMFCLHPDDPKRYVDLSYSQRYDLSRKPIELDSDGIAFVESVRFEPIK